MEYILKTPVKYAHKGEKCEGDTITVEAPSNAVRNFVAKIDVELHKALMKIAEKDFSSNESSESGDEIDGVKILGLMKGMDADLVGCIDALENILSKQAKIDGKENITQPIFKKLSYQDIDGLLGTYIKFFLFTSQQS